MKFLMVLIFLCIACEPTQYQIDEAARRQNSERNMCTKIAASIGDVVSEYRKENGDWLCLIYKKTYLNNPKVVFYQSDLWPISRYLLVK